MLTPAETPAAFSGLIDLASERLGGKALVASDEFFAPKENLLKPQNAIFEPDRYTDRGKWMDGWESRRKRTPGNDWCIIKLGFGGIIRGIDIDTSYFLGNNPSFASVEACLVADPATESAIDSASLKWVEILPKSAIKPGARNLFAVAGNDRWTHVRLNIFPDGGVARFRVYGHVVTTRQTAEPIDLAFVGNGGSVVAASDMFFGNKENLIMPGRAVNMSDGWETKRRRGPGNDWAIIRLGKVGMVTRIELDTAHFKGNFPDTCSIDALSAPGSDVNALTWPEYNWIQMLPRTKLSADAVHCFERELQSISSCSHVRLNIFPDGGVSRLRVWGKPDVG